MKLRGAIAFVIAWSVCAVPAARAAEAAPQGGLPHARITAPPADWIVEGQSLNAQLGNAVASAGDVNGDGYDDVIVGAYSYSPGPIQEGEAFVYLGSAAGLSTTAVWSAHGDQAYELFGWSVGTAGDVNGDGYDDVIVGAPDFGDPGSSGRALVYLGSPSGPSSTPAWVGDEVLSDAYGHSVGTAGDVNGDGFDDVIVGAPTSSDPEGAEGRAFVYTGSALGLSKAFVWTFEGNSRQANFGFAVGTAGDVNGDGFDDVIVGAPLFQELGKSQGRAQVFHGSSTGLSTIVDWSVTGERKNIDYGWSVGTAGDVDGDGYDDVIVGAPFYNSGQADEGRAYVYLGSALGLSTTEAWKTESNIQDQLLGFSVGTAGDVDGDGYDDVVIGEPGAAYTNAGRAALFRGSASGTRTQGRTILGDQDGANFGYSVGSAGDVNGDGADDTLVGAPRYDNQPTDEGRAFAYYGARR